MFMLKILTAVEIYDNLSTIYIMYLSKIVLV